ncbi:mei-9 [Trypoxylus dichotomus]
MVDYEGLFRDKNLLNMLEYETQIFLDILHKDGLVIIAKGLSMDVVLMNILKVYSDPGNLVLVLNGMEFEEKYIIEKLNDDNIHSTTYNTNVAEREDVYLSGGIHFVTTRILVIDMLKDRIPIEKITGIIVLRAHNVLESCQEAFVLRLYRQKNKTGFVKAFSNSPQSFTLGFHHVERIMRTLFVKELYIWPRFHSTVIQSFKKYEPCIIELHVPTSAIMLKLQTCILDLMNLTIKELKRINKTLEMQEVSVENCISKNFHKILQCQLEGIWHQLSTKSKQLIADLKTLQHLITTMLYSDPVTFYSMLAECRTMEYAQTSTWVLLQPADLLFESVKDLIFNKNGELSPEFCPKWSVLLEILKSEIPADIRETGNGADNKVLILCQDKKSCYQLKQFLTRGPHYYLFLTALENGIKFTAIDRKFERCERLKARFSQKERPVFDGREVAKRKKKSDDRKKRKDEVEGQIEEEKREENDETDNLKDQYVLSSTQSKNDEENGADCDLVFEPFEELESMDLTQLTEPPDLTVLIQTFKSDNYLLLQRSLEDARPDYIVLYHSNITVIRQIEVFEARRQKTRPLKIYYLVHAGTVEEQNYLTSLRREKEAFEFLIETRSTMVIPEDQDGKMDDCVNLQRETPIEPVSTRQGGRAASENVPIKQSIIVDMREFRSELPALLHKRGIDIEPVTITVGDYILTPDVCIERKSVSDLVGSLNSGRLYQQCTQMSRYYSKPMLLIEFDQNKQLSWQGNYILSSDGNSFDIQQKLLLLTLHFPKLKIIWSMSPYASVQLFEELKLGKDQPNLEYASAIGSEEDMDILQKKYNSNIYDFIQKLPGITSKNIDAFLRNVRNLDNAITKSKEELKEILGNSPDADLFHSILHEEHMMKGNTIMEKIQISVNEEQGRHDEESKNNTIGNNRKLEKQSSTIKDKTSSTQNLDSLTLLDVVDLTLSSNVPCINAAKASNKTENHQNSWVTDKAVLSGTAIHSAVETLEKLLCNECNEEYEIFCGKCSTIYRILDNKAAYEIDNRASKTLPWKILTLGKPPMTSLGVFARYIIPRHVTFGPLEGLEAGTIRSTWKLKGGRFVVNANNAKRLNWMQFIRRAKTTNRQIERDEELFVYFGEEHARSKNKAVETYFSPKVQKEMRKVYACTYCCIGLLAKDELKRHKSVCPIGKNVDPLYFDIIHCQHCRIYLNKEEYLEYHCNYCEDKHERAWQAHILPEKTSEESIEQPNTKVCNKRKNRKQDQDNKKKCAECSSGIVHDHSNISD